MKNKTKMALINAGIAGALVFTGAFSTGHVSVEGVIIALSTSAVVFLTKMRDYFSSYKSTKSKKGSASFFEFI